MGYNARNDEIRDNVTRMQRDFQAQREAGDGPVSAHRSRRLRRATFMNKFRKLGLIDYNGQIEIHSSLLNVVLHEDPHINS